MATVGFLSVGRILAHEDPLQHADAIYVLGGSWVTRWLEAVDLYHEGYAPLILLSPDEPEIGDDILTQRGVTLPRQADVARSVIVDQLGLPPTALEILGGHVDNTAQEADAIRAIVLARHWRRVIIITDRPSTRRAGFAFRREYGVSLEIIVRCPRYDSFDAAHWWRRRQDLRAVLYEVPKIVSYWFGLKG